VAAWTSVDGHVLMQLCVLHLTRRCRWKKAGADMTEDEVASMSTDTTGTHAVIQVTGLLWTGWRRLTTRSLMCKDQQAKLSTSWDCVCFAAAVLLYAVCAGFVVCRQQPDDQFA
jgi:hypothetical protein